MRSFGRPALCWSFAACTVLIPGAGRSSVDEAMDVYSPCINIGWSVPPAYVVIRDSQGRRNGVDITKALNEVGIGATLWEIPNSQVMWDNIGNDDESATDWGEPQPTSNWSSDLASRVPVTYMLEITGLKDGVERLYLNHTDPAKPLPDATMLELLTYSGSGQRVEVAHDPHQDNLAIRRIVTSASLPGEIGAACRLGLIAPDGVCRSLTAKAEAAAAALRRGRKTAAAGALRAFLNELKAQGGKHVQEPALTILREEAEALLTPAPALKKKRVK